jgi:DNA recombination protein RmuC
MMMVIVAAVVALVVGVAFGVMQGKAALAKKEAELQGRTENYSRAIDEIAKRKAEFDAKCAELDTLRVEKVQLLEQRKSDEERMKDLLSAREQFSNHFKTLANEILDEKSKKFTELNQVNLGQLLNPLKERLGDFQKKVEESHLAETNGRAALSEQLRQLRELNQQMSTDASNLTKALTNTGKVQGDWGELMLSRILESSGLRKDKDYFVQQNFKDSEGRNVRPDVLIRLPENRSLIIDSKTSLTAYNEYVNATDEVTKAPALKRHLESIKKHCKDLSKQSYEDLRDLKSPDFVIMFLPLEPAFMLAISQDDTLWEEAYRGGVLLVSPTTLLFVLRTVAQLWKSEDQKEYVQDIAERGAELYDKLRLFAESMIDIGKSLDDAKESYEDAVKRLSTGSGNAIRQAEMLIELGVKAKKQIPASLVERSHDLLPEERSDAAKV